MIALDTNALVRYLVRDDAERAGALPVYTFDQKAARLEARCCWRTIRLSGSPELAVESWLLG